MNNSDHLNNTISRRNLLRYGLYSSLAGLSQGLWNTSDPAFGQENPRPKKNVLLISLDTVRRDHCSLYGFHQPTTPFLKAFARQGVSFDQAYSPTSTTAPTHASVFTGLYPIGHQLIKNGLSLSEKHETLAGIFQTAGYQTAAVVSSFVLNNKFGFNQGFSFYRDRCAPEEATLRMNEWEGITIDDAFDRRGDYTTNHAIDWLKNQRKPEQPFFMFVHYFDPHNPYTPPKAFEKRFLQAGYASSPLDIAICKYNAEIAFTDQQVQRLMDTVDKMGLADNTLTVIFSDHGEGLMNHGQMYHGVYIYEEHVRVPLIFHLPKVIPGGSILNGPVELVSLAPTILELTGISTPGAVYHGKSLVGAIRGEQTLDPDHPVYLYRRYYDNCRTQNVWVNGEKFGIRRGKWKYIVGREENTLELFDLEKDPKERQNLSQSLPEKIKEFEQDLDQWKKKHTTVEPVQKTISDEDLKKLKSLGYVQ